jgi:hypothetical protein
MLSYLWVLSLKTGVAGNFINIFRGKLEPGIAETDFTITADSLNFNL